MKTLSLFFAVFSIAICSYGKPSLESQLIGMWTRHEESRDHHFNRDTFIEFKSDHTCISATTTQLDAKRHLNTQSGTWILFGNSLIIHPDFSKEPIRDLCSQIDSISNKAIIVSIEANPEMNMPAQTLTYTKTEQDAAANP